MICASCGAENEPGDILCDNCGAPLDTAMETASQPDLGRFLLVPVAGGAAIDLAERAVVGRMNSCDVSVPDKSVSREHARLSRLEGGYLLEDLQSTNGTLVNGYRITEATVVRPGDLLTFGTVDFRMERPGGEAGTVGGDVPAEEQYNGAAEDIWPAAEASEPPGEPEPRLQPEALDDEGAHFSGIPVSEPGVSEGNEAARLADEVVATAAHLSDLAQRLADTSISHAHDTAPAPVDGVDADTIRGIVASVPASPVTPEELEEARIILEGLASNPKDFDLLMRVREMAPQLHRVVQQYGQLEQVLNAVEETVDRVSAG